LWFTGIKVEEKVILVWFYLRIVKPGVSWLCNQIALPLLKQLWLVVKELVQQIWKCLLPYKLACTAKPRPSSHRPLGTRKEEKMLVGCPSRAV